MDHEFLPFPIDAYTVVKRVMDKEVRSNLVYSLNIVYGLWLYFAAYSLN